MAENDAEKAFFQAQAMNADFAGYDKTVKEQGADSSDSDDYDPSKTLQDEFPASLPDSKKSENVSPNDPSPSHFSLPEMNPSQPAGDSNLSQTPSQPESRTPASAPQPKARTIGGFVVEDEDEDENEDKGDADADYEPPVVLGVEDTNTAPGDVSQQPVSGNANQSTSTPDVSTHATMQESATSQNAPNSFYTPSASTVAPKDDVSAIPGQDLYGSQALQPESVQQSAQPTPTPESPSASRGRLPHDRVGILEDRIQEDPRGDIPAWLELINEHKSRNRIDSSRDAYERFLKVFPFAAEQWVSYAIMESEVSELFRLEQIFNRTLLTIPDVQLWSVYLDYVRRRNPLTTDTTGNARKIISSAYDLALQYVGMDKDSGSIWSDYIQFIRSGPGNVGGSGWQDQQKMDLLRKGYQKALCVPTQAVNTLWKEYDQFEMGLNKLTGRKFLQEQSPAYMTARSSYTELQNITRDLIRTSLPRLPPVPGTEGDIEFRQQVEIWERWIKWEQGDPLVLKEDDFAAFRTRVVYVYKQALMALRFYPAMWFDAAEFCFLNGIEAEGNELLKQGMDANPESCLLAFKRADRLEITSESEQDPIKRGAKVREPYDKVLDALYDLIAKARTRESQDVERMEKMFAESNPEKQQLNEEEDDDQSDAKAKESMKSQIDAVRNAHAHQISILSKTVSFAWIALMRAMRRVQGKGKPGEAPGSRQIFADSRKRGRITSDVYIASALIEYHCYKDPAATKIFERGAKLFPEDENFALEYLKHLIDINDVINARAVFEMTVRKLASNPDNVKKTKPIFAFLHEYESRYGDLIQVINLENRMRELFPDDPTLNQFAHRYSTPSFDPTTVQPIISPSQARPKAVYPTGEPSTSRHGTPARYSDAPSTNSPKRPLEDLDDDSGRPRKFIRADSPLKAVPGRRLEQQKRPQQINGSQLGAQFKPQGSPAPLPRDIVHLLSVIPSASAYNAGRFSPERLVDLIRRIEIPGSIAQVPLPQSARGLGGGQTPVGMQPFADNLAMSGSQGDRRPAPAGDPALDKPSLTTDTCKNVDLPLAAFNLNHLSQDQINTLEGGLRHLRMRDSDELVKYAIPTENVPRPGFNTTGKEIEVAVNAYGITKYPNRTVYQYDVHIGNGAEKTAIINKVWNSNARKNALRQTIFDGQKLAWSMNNYRDGLNVEVDLDSEQGRPAGRTSNRFRLVVRPTKTVNLAVLRAWLQGQTSMQEPVLEALNFLDHVLREYPSQKFLAIRRSFFDENGENQDLGNGVLAFKGVYQAIRPAISRGLVVNVDVSNTCFWARTSYMGAAMAILDCRDRQQLMALLKPVKDGHGGTTESPAFYEVHRRLRKLQVQPHYRGCPVLGTNFIVKGLINGNARQYTIDLTDKATGKKETINIETYFKRKYNLNLDYWELPMVEMTKKGVVYPMEVLTIHGLHKYPWKLNEHQTTQMIRYAASRPADRLRSVQNSKKMLDHSNDPVLQTFGVQVDNNMIRTKARLLRNPEIQFGGNQRHNPGTNGRWDLRGKKFYQPNKKPLDAWGVGFFSGKRNSANGAQVKNFCNSLKTMYSGHGGRVVTDPVILELKEDVGEAIKRLYNSTGVKFQKDPQLLVIVVPDKNSFTYTRIKKSCDCRWGVPSQVVQAAHVAKNNPQYISNVLMKVNAKLGGATARAIPKAPGAALKPQSMIIGADVTHPALGVWSPSMAAMAVCMDTFGGRYWGACESNGERIEMIARSNIEVMLTPLVREWMATVGGGRAPDNVYYFRDGVSTGQYEQVLQQEVFDMKSIFMKLTQDQWKGKFTVVVANKRHHIRAFPDKSVADRNLNPLPGTLIERDVTSPHDWDFLLYSHIALQGTSRPVHYHVILDQIKHRPEELENMIYDHCYQYMRSTTSVSLFPAVYYAHLVATRARHHEDVPASSGPQSGPEVKMTNPRPQNQPVDPRLLPIHGTSNRLPFGMWFV